MKILVCSSVGILKCMPACLASVTVASL